MIVYRGVKDKPETDYLKKGFTNYPAYMAPPQDTLQKWFISEVSKFSTKNFKGATISGKVRDLAFDWRKSTPGGLIATAITEEGAYDTMPYVYKIEIPDDELWAWMLQDNGTPVELYQKVGKDAKFPDCKHYMLIANNKNLGEASILALYHGPVNTKEVTFMTPILRKYIAGWRNGGTNNRGKYQAMP